MKKILLLLSLPMVLPGCASIALFGFAADSVTVAKTGKTMHQHAFKALETGPKHQAHTVLPGQNVTLALPQKPSTEGAHLAQADHIYGLGKF